MPETKNDLEKWAKRLQKLWKTKQHSKSELERYASDIGYLIGKKFGLGKTSATVYDKLGCFLVREYSHLPAEDQARLRIEHVYGRLMRFAGKPGAAIDSHRNVLEKQKQSPGLGEDHEDTWTTMYHLALCLYEVDKTSMEAKDIARELVKLNHQMFGPVHGRTKNCQRLLDAIILNQTKY